MFVFLQTAQSRLLPASFVPCEDSWSIQDRRRPLYILPGTTTLLTWNPPIISYFRSLNFYFYGTKSAEGDDDFVCRYD